MIPYFTVVLLSQFISVCKRLSDAIMEVTIEVQMIVITRFSFYENWQSYSEFSATTLIGTSRRSGLYLNPCKPGHAYASQSKMQEGQTGQTGFEGSSYIFRQNIGIEKDPFVP